MERLKGHQRNYLRGLAHGIKPHVMIGQKGLSRAVIEAVDQALEDHELIKIKFLEFKDKEQKKAIAETIENETDSELVGMIGHMAIFYRQHPDPERQKIRFS